jgi:hypothetical protein
MTEFLQDTSVAELHKVLKEFEFSPMLGFDPFSRVSFSDATKVRLDASDWYVKLKGLATGGADDGFYSTDDDLWFRTWVTNPKSLRRLLMLQVVSDEPKNSYGETVVSTQVRIYDGTDDYYWDGAAWSVAGAGDWNDEGTFNANIATFDVLPGRQFAITVNLKTTDREVTPLVKEIKVLMECRIDFMEDLIFRSLIPELENNIQPLGNLPLVADPTNPTSTIDLDEWRINTNFNIADVEAVFDFTADPELLTDLLDTYDTGTHVITLTSPIPAGNIPFILFRYKPEVMYTTHQDWIEVAKYPSLILQRVEVPVASAYNLAAREGIVDKGTGNAYVLSEPWRATYEFRIHGVTDNPVDEFRLASRILKFLESNKMIRSVGLDEYFRMRVIRELRDLVSPDRADTHVIWTQFVIEDVRLPFLVEQTYAVTSLKMQFREPAPAHEDPVKGGARVVLTSHRDDGPTAWEEEIEVTE